MAERRPTYHDLHITTRNIPRTSIFNLPFRVQVHCTRVGGWQVWAMAEGDLPEELLGSEYDAERPLILDVAGHVIVDSMTTAAQDRESVGGARLGLLDRSQLAALFNCSERTVHRRQQKGMPVVRFGQTPLYDPEAVRAWLLAQGGGNGEMTKRPGRPPRQGL